MHRDEKKVYLRIHELEYTAIDTAIVKRFFPAKQANEH